MRSFRRIGRERALAIARAECERRGWPWLEPVSIHGGLLAYTIRTQSNVRGGNVWIRVSARDGSVGDAERGSR